jgi:hypothetical protein
MAPPKASPDAQLLADVFGASIIDSNFERS